MKEYNQTTAPLPRFIQSKHEGGIGIVDNRPQNMAQTKLIHSIQKADRNIFQAKGYSVLLKGHSEDAYTPFQETRNHKTFQLKNLYRYGTESAPNTFVPRKPVPADKTIEKHCEQMLKASEDAHAAFEIEEEDEGDKGLFLAMAAYCHADENLGVNNSMSPFLSCCADHEKAHANGSIKFITNHAESIFSGDVPDERVVVPTHPTSQEETEELVWLKEGETLKTWMTTKIPNPYKKS